MDYCGSGGNCAIDESMIKCKSKLPYIIYQPQKLVHHGIQVFVWSNSPSGYVQQFQIYVGSKLTKVSKNGLYFDIVNSLTKPLCGTYARVLTMLTLVSQFYTTSKVTIYWHVVLSGQ